jgi:hypothetical protein
MRKPTQTRLRIASIVTLLVAVAGCNSNPSTPISFVPETPAVLNFPPIVTDGVPQILITTEYKTDIEELKELMKNRDQWIFVTTEEVQWLLQKPDAKEFKEQLVLDPYLRFFKIDHTRRYGNSRWDLVVYPQCQGRGVLQPTGPAACLPNEADNDFFFSRTREMPKGMVWHGDD